MNYQQMYKEIPVKNRNEVWHDAGVGKATVSRWLSGKGNQTTPAKRVKIAEVIFDKWKIYNLIKNMRIAFGKLFIVAGHPMGNNDIPYDKLLAYKLYDERTKHTSMEAVEDLLTDAKNVIANLWDQDEDATRVLIARYVIWNNQNQHDKLSIK